MLSFPEWKQCRRLFREKGIQTFADWLHHYNNLDVAPGLEALQTIRAFYTFYLSDTLDTFFRFIHR